MTFKLISPSILYWKKKRIENTKVEMNEFFLWHQSWPIDLHQVCTPIQLRTQTESRRFKCMNANVNNDIIVKLEVIFTIKTVMIIELQWLMPGIIELLINQYDKPLTIYWLDFIFHVWQVEKKTNLYANSIIIMHELWMTKKKWY